MNKKSFIKSSRRKLILVLVALLTFCFIFTPFQNTKVQAWDNGIDATPAMGWNSWYGYYMNPTETVIKQVADAMVSRGFLAAGYKYCNIDDGWMASTRDSNGNLQGDPVKFPGGMQFLASYVHSKNLKFGLYECAGTLTCGGLPGSYGHYQQDANQYAAWGIDHMKLDFCNASGLDPKTQYTQMSSAIANSGRAINFNMCEWGVDAPWTWGAPISNSWRIAGDSADAWNYMMYELDSNAGLAPFAGANHWNDPDYLMGGLGGCTYEEYKSQFSLWCIMAAPLFLSANVATMSQTYVDMYTNPEVIAVDQDSGCIQGSRVAVSGTSEVWCKPLGTNGTTKAVALLNRSSSAANITVNWTDIGFASRNATIRDLWAKSNLGTFANTYTASVPAHGTVLLKIAGTPGLPGTPTINDDSGLINYGSNWSDSDRRGLGDYFDDVHYTYTNGATVQFTFTGTGVGYVSEKGSDMGNVDIYIDNVFKQNVNLYNSSRLLQQTVYSINGLSPGSHTIKIVNKTSSCAIIDSIKVYTTDIVNDDHSSIIYDVSWNNGDDRGLGDYNNDVHYTYINGATLQYTFRGTGLDYISEKAADMGDVDIYIDNIFKQNVNLNSPARLLQQVVYSVNGLSDSVHTIKIINKSANCGMVDAFKVYHQ